MTSADDNFYQEGMKVLRSLKTNSVEATIKASPWKVTSPVEEEPNVVLTALSVNGPSFPGTAANDAGTGSVTWVNPNNIEASDGSYAQALALGSSTSNYLKGTNFGFSIAGSDIIDGIELEIKHLTSVTETEDSVVKLLKAGSIVGSNYASGTPWINTDQVITYGGSSDLWGTSWSASDINDSSFGAVLAVTFLGGDTAGVDYFKLTVWSHATDAVGSEYFEIGSGGVVCGGSAPLDVSKVGTGGAVCGGIGVNTIVTSVLASGGVVCGGSGIISGITNLVGAGGALAGGAATTYRIYFEHGTGGAVVSGLAKVGGTTSFISSGGVVVNRPQYPGGFDNRIKVTIKANRVKSNQYGFDWVEEFNAGPNNNITRVGGSDLSGNPLPTALISYHSASGNIAVSTRVDIAKTTSTIYYVYF